MGTIKNITMAIAICLTAAGCQSTGSIDTAKTASVEPTDISAMDLASGKEQFREANFGLAEKHFRKTVELNAMSASGWLGLAASYDQLGRFDFSDRAYEQLIKLQGKKPEILNNQGYSQLLRGNHKKAGKLFAEALAARPGDPRILANIELMKKMRG
jgi:Flp pilus assembly protein TadD